MAQLCWLKVKVTVCTLDFISRLGTARNKITGGGGGGCLTSLHSTNPRPWFCFSSSDKTAVHLAVAGGVFDGVFCAVLFPLDVSDEIWDLIESVSEGFLTCS